jgi:hypothetical protein
MFLNDPHLLTSFFAMADSVVPPMSLTGDVSASTTYGTTVSDQFTVNTIDIPSLIVGRF